jgi:hypothetical protein
MRQLTPEIGAGTKRGIEIALADMEAPTDCSLLAVASKSKVPAQSCISLQALGMEV